MNLVLLTTPSFTGSRSMPRYALLVGEGMRERGHSVAYRTAEPLISQHFASFPSLQKWARYADQYLLFPRKLRHSLKKDPPDTLYVVTDQGLGMWVPQVARRHHVIHCHDLLAIRSALGEFTENPLTAPGRIYQRMILSGLMKGKNFISVSEATGRSLESLVPSSRGIREVLPNALHRKISPLDGQRSLELPGLSNPPAARRPIVHVGGNQWYKNRRGVLEIYRAYAAMVPCPRPLWMIGAPPPRMLQGMVAMLPAGAEVRFMTDLGDKALDAVYSIAHALLFPSLEEGFGWPVAEALAAGCPVVATGIEPMTAVGSEALIRIPRKRSEDDWSPWARECAAILAGVPGLGEEVRDELTAKGMALAEGFDRERFLQRCEEIYSRVLSQKP